LIVSSSGEPACLPAGHQRGQQGRASLLGFTPAELGIAVGDSALDLWDLSLQ